MANFLINEATVSVTNSNNTHAFDGDSAGADQLTVTLDGFLIALGNNSNGARLTNTGAWKVKINGLIYSQDDDGIRLLAGNTAQSTFTIGAEGEVSGNGSGKGAINLESAAKLTNAGSVQGEVFGILAQAPVTITNSGTISGTGGGSFGIVVTVAGVHTIVNSGTISAVSAAYFDQSAVANDKITNSGTIIGGLQLGNGINSVTNSGTIDEINAGDGNDTVVNSKTITVSVSLAAGTNVLTNSGTIGSDPSGNTIQGDDGNDTITNSKTIVGNLILDAGNNTVKNSGTITGFVFNEGGDDTITNSGTIATSNGNGTLQFGAGNNRLTNSKLIDVALVQFGNGNDTVTNSGTIAAQVDLGDGTNSFTNSGTVAGTVFGGSGADTVKNTGTAPVFDLGDGNDSFTGGNAADVVRDGGGSDTYNLGKGNDTYFAARTSGTDGTDTIDGGAGIDTYNASEATDNVRINLDTVDHDMASIGAAGAEVMSKNTAIGGGVADAAKDTIRNFENAIGGSTVDVIYGSALANVIDGLGGTDFLFGFGGNDTLRGGDGTDDLIGGKGRDTLDGGAFDGDADRFIYTALSDSTVARAGRDQIINFEDGLDRIDLALIDAIAGGADDAFTLVNPDSSVNPAGLFSGVAGQLRTQATATGWLIQGDVNGDRKADFAIDIVDPTHAIVLTAADFFL
jgi:Ca2+-binding RTX toxin-like protein